MKSMAGLRRKSRLLCSLLLLGVQIIMLDIHPVPPEEMPLSPEVSISQDEIDDPETLPVAPPTLRERIQAAQRARTLQTQPSVEPPAEGTEHDHDTES